MALTEAQVNTGVDTLPNSAVTTITTDPGRNLKTAPRGTYNATPPVLTNGQQAPLQFDSSGSLKTVGGTTIGPAAAANLVSGTITTAMTATTSTLLLAAPGASLRNYVTQITVSNSHATVGTDLIVQDGNGGTTLYVIPAAAVYGGASISFPQPLRQPTLNTGLYIANVTTGSSTKASASGYSAA